MLKADHKPVVTAEKASADKLAHQVQVFRDDRFVRQMLDAIPSLLAVLNAHRQIIYANRSLIEMLEFDEEEELLGLRPGDVFDCVHVFDAENGCGTGAFCRSCGALTAIISRDKRVAECRMTRLRDSLIQAHELEVTSTPFAFAGDTFTIFSIIDKSAEHRRQMLERIFFHDIMNVVGSIKGFAELLEHEELDDRQKVYQQIREAAEQVIGEVEAQRDLSDAEHGRLEIKQEYCASLDILQRVVRLYERHKTAAQRQIVIDAAAVNEYLVTDQNLLLRILGNMVVNALEAIAAGGTVTLNCQAKEGEILFSVHNPGVIPAAIKPEIFRRTYSTKGTGRGLGTYSMRLLSGFLRGDVAFASDDKEGTAFSFRVPQNLER